MGGRNTHRFATVSIGAAFVIAMTLSSCREASGCSEFQPKSGEMEIGESVELEVELENGGWGVVDLAGWYWATSEPSPPLADGLHQATATRTGEETMVITIVGQPPTEFVGPVSCE